MIYGSVCSGIEAASVAWSPLGWKPAFLSEIEKFPRAVLAHHYPDVTCHGDFTTIKADEYAAIDLLVGGTPCQSFSIAGLRGGLDDDRGNLALEYLRLADRLKPRWIVWENVPGVLSSNGGRDFGAILGGMVELGYGFAYRLLDAQYVRTREFPFAVPQRRRRVFVVGYFGDWRRAGAVLFEREGLSGNSPPRRQEDARIAVSPTLRARSNSSHRADSQAYVETFDRQSSAEYGTDLIASTVSARDYKSASHLICFSVKDHGADAMTNISPTLRAGGHHKSHANAGVMPAVTTKTGVRRLTPVECERLQGFPDGYTDIPWRGKTAPDGPRYKALGNSMAVPVMSWIGQRIAMVDALPR